jgi:pantoate--beta-alanine ligase
VRPARDRKQLWDVTRRWKRAGREVALVPTMGNLHEGHLALVRAARNLAERVVASIYVNPAQFGEGEDFGQYPRTLERDLERLEREGCDLAFVPDERTMYPFSGEGAIRVRAARDLSSILEGACRPGHFDGVVTVVARLFNLVGPDVAVFGEKDYQQLLMIRRLVDDLGYPINIHAVPTVREEGGLAMSSRNRYLDAGQQQAAQCLNRALNAACEAIREGSDRVAVERNATAELEAAGFLVDYVAVRRASDLGLPEPGDTKLRVLAAARIGATRLIDNFSVA